jgi:hypothetical protein
MTADQLLAPVKEPKQSKALTLANIRRRNNDVYSRAGEEIKGNQFMRVAGEVFKEQKWLLDYIDLLHKKLRENDISVAGMAPPEEPVEADDEEPEEV